MCVSHPSTYPAVVIATPQSREKHHIYFTPEPGEPFWTIKCRICAIWLS